MGGRWRRAVAMGGDEQAGAMGGQWAVGREGGSTKDHNKILGRALLQDLLPFGHTKKTISQILEQPKPLNHLQSPETARIYVSPANQTDTSKLSVPIHTNVKLVEKKTLNTFQTMTNAASTSFTPTALRAHILGITTKIKTTGTPMPTTLMTMETTTITQTESRRLQIKNGGNVTPSPMVEHDDGYVLTTDECLEIQMDYFRKLGLFDYKSTDTPDCQSGSWGYF
ncbi:hypothetical protein FA15DRAFT_711907 [Coprinopsis marcescibilis]|uniref:Uncharacterized protein n=1 Tax=Coprinopsis marcescibilis TaxID=230819 RepID=A0A5C3K954_COPMA|nr:hypothetical protein FA15DRAFT_711907 [Coprinopsis marcescibilis]